MARFYAERVAFTTPTTDDGNVAIGSRLGNSFRLPSEASISNGDNPILLIQEGDDVEVVEATYVSAGPHFTLDTVIFSIISGSVGTTKMNLNGAAEVRFMSASAADLLDILSRLAAVEVIGQNSQSAAYTLVLADAGKHILHPAADTTARTWTIPANASVAFDVGTVVSFRNEPSAGAITIAITSDTLELAGTALTGSRTLAAGGMATALKTASTKWVISGVGLS